MTPKTFEERFQIAAERFRKFFQELEGFFVEREEILTQIALALLAKEHVLLTGPPGNAKSQIATLVLRRIIDEKTQRPSVYARQFTENTVQTDLVGPINFKTLVDSGRTEHFTDEGMLGAVHAFLDEVFDGRDMLLRSTLNILQERELKEGTKTVQGQIECAVMTSNRYLAELLEGSRDTLLAFIDRIAFISFVPKGFADPQNLSLVLRRQLSGEQQVRLSASLLVQDLDVLQEAADNVYTSTEACDALGQFLLHLDAETQSVVRADPHYIPTRYLSTRTAVRAGKILRAICIYDKIFHVPERVSEVMKKDFEKLYLHLLLSGQPKDRITRLLAQETDTRERRQLEIVRTEREIFDRCISRIPEIQPKTKTNLLAPVDQLDSLRLEALQATSTRAAMEAIQKLTQIASTNRELGQQSLNEALDHLPRLIMQESINALASEMGTLKVIDRLGLLADQSEEASAQNRQLALWLRGKALSLIESLARLAPISAEPTPRELNSSEKPVAAAITATEAILNRLEVLSSRKAMLLAKGINEQEPRAEESWRAALYRAQDELALLWDEILFMAVRESLQANPDETLSRLFIALRPAFNQLDSIGERLASLGHPQHAFKLKVVGPRLKGMLKAAFEQFDSRSKVKVLEGVSALLRQLDSAKLSGMVPPQDILDWSAESLIRGEQKEPTHSTYSKEGFASLRESFGATNAQTLLEIGVRVFPSLEGAATNPAKTAEALRSLIGSLPEETKRSVGLADLRALEHQISFLEKWWSSLLPDKVGALNASDSFALLGSLIQSGVLGLLRQEAIGVRLVSATNEVSALFPELSSEAKALCLRVEFLEEETARILLQLSMKRADEAWSRLERK